LVFFPRCSCVVKTRFGEQLLARGCFWSGFSLWFWGFSARWGGAGSIRGPSSPAGHRLLPSIPPVAACPGSAEAAPGGRRGWPLLAIAGGPRCCRGMGSPPSSLLTPLCLPSSSSLPTSTWGTKCRVAGGTSATGGISATRPLAGPRGASLNRPLVHVGAAGRGLRCGIPEGLGDGCCGDREEGLQTAPLSIHVHQRVPHRTAKNWMTFGRWLRCKYLLDGSQQWERGQSRNRSVPGGWCRDSRGKNVLREIGGEAGGRHGSLKNHGYAGALQTHPNCRLKFRCLKGRAVLAQCLPHHLSVHMSHPHRN